MRQSVAQMIQNQGWFKNHSWKKKNHSWIDGAGFPCPHLSNRFTFLIFYLVQQLDLLTITSSHQLTNDTAGNIYELTFLAELFGSLINHGQLSKFQLLLTLVWPMWGMAGLKCNTCDSGRVPCEFQLRLTCEIAFSFHCLLLWWCITEAQCFSYTGGWQSL